MKYVGATFLLVMAMFSHANTMPAVVAKVTGTGTYANGDIYIFFDRQISSCSTNLGRIDIAENSPAKQQMLSVAIAAFASGRSVKIYPSSCNGASSVFGNGRSSYFYLTDLEPN